MALHTTYLTTEFSEPFTYFTDGQRNNYAHLIAMI